MKRQRRFFFKRGQKVVLPHGEKQIVVPFKPISLVAILILTLAAVYLFFRSDLFLVRNFEVEAVNADCVENVNLTSELGILGKSLIFLDTNLPATKLTGKFPCLAKANLEKKFPDTLKLKLTGRQAVAAVTLVQNTLPIAVATVSAQIATDSATFSLAAPIFAVDVTGTVFKKLATTQALPKFPIAAETIDLNQKLPDQEILAGLEFLAALQGSKPLVDQIQITAEKQILAKLEDDLLVIISPEKEIATQVASLQAIIKQAKIEGTKISLVDLRFKNPILKLGD